MIYNHQYQCVKETGKVWQGCHKCHNKYGIWRNIVFICCGTNLESLKLSEAILI